MNNINSQGAETGDEEFITSLEALPQQYAAVRSKYLNEVQNAKNQGIKKSFGKMAEHVVQDILVSEGFLVSAQPYLYEFTIRGKKVKRVRPDLKVGQKSYVEVTKWGDSNKMASMLANGLLVKHKIPEARFYAIVASYKSSSKLAWTDYEEVDFWLGEAAKKFHVNPIDGYFGFATIDELVKVLKKN